MQKEDNVERKERTPDSLTVKPHQENVLHWTVHYNVQALGCPSHNKKETG